MIVKKFEDITVTRQSYVEVPESRKQLYLVRASGSAYFTDVNMVELNEKLRKVNDRLDYGQLNKLGQPAEFMRVHIHEDGYAFKLVENGKSHSVYVEPQLFTSGLHFSCEVFMSMSIDKLLELTLESRLDLDQQLNSEGRLIAVKSIDGAEHWYPKICPFFYNAYDINEGKLTVEKVTFALVAWASVINEKYENMLHTCVNKSDLMAGLRDWNEPDTNISPECRDKNT